MDLSQGAGIIVRVITAHARTEASRQRRAFGVMAKRCEPFCGEKSLTPAVGLGTDADAPPWSTMHVLADPSLTGLATGESIDVSLEGKVERKGRSR
jgi:hypothetical protein